MIIREFKMKIPFVFYTLDFAGGDPLEYSFYTFDCIFLTQKKVPVYILRNITAIFTPVLIFWFVFSVFPWL